MKWRRLLELLRGEVVFRSALLLSSGEPVTSIRRQLERWVGSGRLEQLRRGVYAVAAPYRARIPHPFAVAGLLRPASYVSLQSALSFHGLIPEHVPTVTSVTAARPETLCTPLGSFVFRHVSPPMFWGYQLERLPAGETAFVAHAEKAVLDTVHLTPGGDTYAFLHELRLQNLDVMDLDRLRAVADRADSPKLRRAAARVARLAVEAGS